MIKGFLKDPDLREVLSGTAVALVLKVFGACLSFGFTVLLAQYFGAEGSGVYFLALSIITIFTVVGMFGMGTSSVRYVALFSQSEKWSDVHQVSKLVDRTALIFLTVISSVLFLSADILSDSILKAELSEPLRWMALAILPFGILQLYAEKLRGLKQIGKSSSLQGLVFPALNLLGLYLFFEYYGALSPAFSFVIASFITMAVAILYWRNGHFFTKNGNVTLNKNDFFVSCKSVFVGDIATRIIIPWAPFILLGVWVSTSEVGIYGVANRVSMLTAFVLVAINSIAAPKISALYHEKNMKQLDKVAKKSTLLMTVIVLPFLLSIMIFTESIMSLFGDEFSYSVVPLQILLAGQLVNVMCGPVGYMLMMTGNESIYKKITTFSIVIMLSTSLYMIPAFGVNGAALATAITMVFQNFLFAYFGYKKIGVSTLWFLKRKIYE